MAVNWERLGDYAGKYLHHKAKLHPSTNTLRAERILPWYTEVPRRVLSNNFVKHAQTKERVALINSLRAPKRNFRDCDIFFIHSSVFDDSVRAF